MRRIILFCLSIVSVMMFASQSWAQEKPLIASQILGKVDDVINAPNDQDLKIKLILINKKGEEKIREMSMIQKGSDKRMVKFLSPADQRGIAFLSLPDDIMYLYLPAFKKTRRIASHVKNTRFAETDFTYEDMEAKRYSEKYIPELLKIEKNETEPEKKQKRKDKEMKKEKEKNYYILQLNPKKEVKTDYSKLIMWVRTDNFYPTKIEHYDRGNKLYKIMIREKVEKASGYWISKESEMEDLKINHKTKMIIVDVRFDSGLSNDKFTKRYLSR